MVYDKILFRNIFLKKTYSGITARYHIPDKEVNHMFDYKKFEDRLVLQMENTLAKLLKEHDDIYIFSLSLSSDADSVWVIANTTHNLEETSDPGDEEYYYYKYCEEEWDLWETDDFDSISEELDNYDVYEEEDGETDNGEDAFCIHRDKAIESCQNALIRFNTYKNKNCPGLLLAFYVREYLGGEECIELFEKLNSKEALAEYSEHIEDFV